MTTCIYRIDNMANGLFYIGSAVDFRRRCAVHKSRLRKGLHANKRLQRDWDKFGEKSFDFSVKVICSKDMLLVYEQALIDGLGAVSDGYNVLNVAGSAIGFKHSAEHRSSLIGNKHAEGLVHTDESRALISKALAGNKYGLGSVRSTEHRAAISAAQRGRKQTPEQVAKRVAATVATKTARRLSCA